MRWICMSSTIETGCNQSLLTGANHDGTGTSCVCSGKWSLTSEPASKVNICIDCSSIANTAGHCVDRIEEQNWGTATHLHQHIWMSYLSTFVPYVWGCKTWCVYVSEDGWWVAAVPLLLLFKETSLRDFIPSLLRGPLDPWDQWWRGLSLCSCCLQVSECLHIYTTALVNTWFWLVDNEGVHYFLITGHLTFNMEPEIQYQFAINPTLKTHCVIFSPI